LVAIFAVKQPHQSSSSYSASSSAASSGLTSVVSVSTFPLFFRLLNHSFFSSDSPSSCAQEQVKMLPLNQILSIAFEKKKRKPNYAERKIQIHSSAG
jgi:hypothetical protein